jgi:hypothetical protein
MNSVKNYMEISIPRELREKVQILAASQNTSEDTAFEQIIRHGLEAYLAEHAAGADAAIGALSELSPVYKAASDTGPPGGL